MRPLLIARLLAGLCLLAGACTSTSPESGIVASTEISPPETTDDSVRDVPPTTDQILDGPIVQGEPLPVASERHREGEPTVGLVSPSLTHQDLVVPSDRPTLLLVAVGSCADCAAVAEALTPLAIEHDAVAVVIGPDDTPEMPEPWVVVASNEVALAFGGRDRPTALVVGVDGVLLSRVRPYNRTGTDYDAGEIGFGLQIASNQTLGTEVATAPTPVDDGRAGPLPDSFVGIETNGDLVEVDTATGQTMERIAGLADGGEDEIQSQVFDDVLRIPGSDTFVVNECCEPAAGFVSLIEDWTAYDHAESHSGPGFNVWEVSPSVDGKFLAFSGYLRFIFELGTDPSQADRPLGESDGSNPDVAWLRDRLGVVYLHRGNSPAVVELIEFDSDYRPISRRNFLLEGPGSAMDVNADGKIVVAVNHPAGQAANGQVYDPDTGELFAEFALETGVFDVDYDVTGRFLAYVDRDGFARWQGGGDSGVLGEGYLAVSW